jgi:D-3-phosphoglycerate dehydrogenase
VAEERGIELEETKRTMARDFADLVRVTVTSGEERTRVTGTVVGRHARPHLLEAWGQRFNLQLEPHLAVFRYRDQPGMVGRVGTALGDAGVNIASAAVGHVPDDDGTGAGNGGEAVMVLTTEEPVPQDVVDAICGAGGFTDGRAVSLPAAP